MLIHPSKKSVKKQYTSAKTCRHRLSDIIDMLSGVKEQSTKENILKKVCQSQREMDIFLKTNITYLKSLIKISVRSSSGMENVKKKLRDIYGDYLDDNVWLCKLLNLNLKSTNALSAILAHEESVNRPGRKMTTIEERQNVYNFWKKNSGVSVHRSNNRHMVKVAVGNIKKQTVDLHDDDDDVCDAVGKQGPKKQAHRQQAYHVLHNLFKQTHGFQHHMGFL